MKTEKKLTRGLSDLSPLFAPPAKPTKKPFFIKKPEVNFWDATRLALLSCGTFLSVRELADAGYEMHLLRALGWTFQKSYYVSVEPTYERYETLSRLFPIPPFEHMVGGEAIRFHPLSGLTHFVHVGLQKFREMTQLKPAFAPLEFDESRRALLVFDNASVENLKLPLVNLLDFVVLVTTASSEHLMETYENIRKLVSYNPAIRFSVLFAGEDASAMSEFVYDGFCEIVSHYAGCDLAFLGWMERADIKVNSEVLIQGGGSVVQNTLKARLSEAFRLAEC